MKRRQKLRKTMVGALFERDRLWRITGPGFVAGLCDYNDEITGYSPILKKELMPYVYYSGRASFVLNQCAKLGFKVEHVVEGRRKA